MAARSGRPSPNPGLSPVVELLRRHFHRTLDLTGIGRALARERIATEQPPPTLLQIEPARAFGDEHMLDAWMLRQPGAGFQAIVTAQIVHNDENVPLGIVGFDSLEQLDGVLGVARSGTSRQFFAIADTQRAIDPDLPQIQ